jgi:hypothetical protein
VLDKEKNVDTKAPINPNIGDSQIRQVEAIAKQEKTIQENPKLVKNVQETLVSMHKIKNEVGNLNNLQAVTENKTLNINKPEENELKQAVAENKAIYIKKNDKQAESHEAKSDPTPKTQIKIARNSLNNKSIATTNANNDINAPQKRELISCNAVPEITEDANVNGVKHPHIQHETTIPNQRGNPARKSKSKKKTKSTKEVKHLNQTNSQKTGDIKLKKSTQKIEKSSKIENEKTKKPQKKSKHTIVTTIEGIYDSSQVNKKRSENKQL